MEVLDFLRENNMWRTWVMVLICSSFASQAVAASGDPTIRVLNAYTDDFLNTISSHNVNTTVNAQISLLNQALADSGVHLNVVSAGVKVIPNLPIPKSPTDTTTIQQAFSQIRNSYPLQKARDDLNADVIMVLAYSGYTSVTRIVGPEYGDEAVSLIGAGTVDDLGYLHEFGHLLGARHQSYGGDPPSSNDPVGNGHGWYERVKLTTTNACSHTIMAYEPIPNLNGIKCTSGRVRRFSNPLYCDDFTGLYGPTGVAYGCLPWGDGTHNNSAVISSRISLVSNFRLSKYSQSIVSNFIFLLTTLGFE